MEILYRLWITRSKSAGNERPKRIETGQTTHYFSGILLVSTIIYLFGVVIMYVCCSYVGFIGGKNLQGTGWSGAWGGFPPSYIEQICLIK